MYRINWLRPFLLLAEERFPAYARLCRLDKPIGIWLLLWPTLVALWIAADGPPPLAILVIFLIGVTLTRSAGCVVNDLVDRDLDGSVSRTRARPLVTKESTVREALLLAIALSLFTASLLFFLNRLTVYLALVAPFLVVLYPYMKRYTYLAQFWLGCCFSWGIIMAFSAIQNAVPPIAWLLFLANLLWTVSYDTLYAMVDREDDKKLGIKSTAILFAEDDRLIIGIIQLLALLAWILLGTRAELGAGYYAGLAVASGFGLFQQYLIRNREPKFCFRAFLNNNWLGLAILIGVMFDYVLFKAPV